MADTTTSLDLHLVYEPADDPDGSDWDRIIASLFEGGLEPDGDEPYYVEDGLHFYALRAVERGVAPLAG